MRYSILLSSRANSTSRPSVTLFPNRLKEDRPTRAMLLGPVCRGHGDQFRRMERVTGIEPNFQLGNVIPASIIYNTYTNPYETWFGLSGNQDSHFDSLPLVRLEG